jgi:hypothetical protein
MLFQAFGGIEPIKGLNREVLNVNDFSQESCSLRRVIWISNALKTKFMAKMKKKIPASSVRDRLPATDQPANATARILSAVFADGRVQFQSVDEHPHQQRSSWFRLRVPRWK